MLSKNSSKIDFRKRHTCAVCDSPGLSVKIEARLPILPICTEQPHSEDVIGPLDIAVCDSCGLIQLVTLVPPDVLYSEFHSEGQGPSWQEHYRRFANLILERKTKDVFEIGAGQGQLVRHLQGKVDLTVLEPTYRGPTEGVRIIKSLLSEEVCLGLGRQWEAVVSSHTLEHFHEFNDYFRNSRLLLRDGGLLFTAVPNLEFSFSQSYANTLHPEHTAVLTFPHLLFLHRKNGYEVEAIDSFKDHTLYFVARKTEPAAISLSMSSYSQALLQSFRDRMEARARMISHQARPDVENWLFGASNLAQVLFAFGVVENAFAGLLDNSKLKQGKRLYGTSLRVQAPEALRGKKARIFVNGAAYTTEICEQLKAEKQSWEVVPL